MTSTSAPLVTVPVALLPKAKTHPVNVAATNLDTARTNLAKALDALDAAEVGTDERLAAWEREKAAAVADMAKGEAASLPARPSEADAAQAVEVARAVVTEADRNLAQAVKAYDTAVRDALGEILPSLTARMHEDAAKAAAAGEAARGALRDVLASRSLALDLRAAEAFAAMRARDVQPVEDYEPVPGTEGIVRSVGMVSVHERASRAAAVAFAKAPPVSETAAAMEAVLQALQDMQHEDPSATWTGDRLPRDIALALGLAVAPLPMPPALESPEEWKARYNRAIANREPIPAIPSHLEGRV